MFFPRLVERLVWPQQAVAAAVVVVQTEVRGLLVCDWWCYCCWDELLVEAAVGEEEQWSVRLV